MRIPPALPRLMVGMLTATFLAGIVTWRYRELRAEVNSIHFFGRANQILSLTGGVRLDPTAPARIPEDLKRREGNLAAQVQALFPHIPAVDWLDPFAPGPDSSRVFPLYFGYVRHVSAALNYPIESRPVWFVWGPGPSGLAPRLFHAGTRDFYHQYEFHSAPYHPSNGLISEGYFYADSAGNRVGEAN